MWKQKREQVRPIYRIRNKEKQSNAVNMNRCIINIKALAESNGQNEVLHLDDTFFESFDSSEIAGGNIEVSIKSSKLAEANVYSVTLDIKGTVKIPCTRCLDMLDFEVDLADSVEVCAGRQLNDEERDEGKPAALITGDCDMSERIFETISLNIPIVHCHPEGLCNKTMIEKLNEHSASRIDETIN